MVEDGPSMLQVRVAPLSTSDAAKVPDTELVPRTTLPSSLDPASTTLPTKPEVLPPLLRINSEA